MLEFIIGLALGAVGGFIGGRIWKSRKLSSSTDILKDGSLDTKQKLDKLTKLWG